MREFILLALKGLTSKKFSKSDKTETGLICRTISNTLWASRDIRRDTIIHICLNGPPTPPRIITFRGEHIGSGFGFDEKTIATIIDKALEKGKDLQKDQSITLQPGIEIKKQSFESLIKQKSEEQDLYYLHKKGNDIRGTQFNEDSVFIFGDLFGIPKKTEKLLQRYANRLSLGPEILFASHCSILVHNELDRRR